MSNLYPLFCYGTLMDGDIQQALFGKTFSSTPATLPEWGLFEAVDNGYLFIKPEQDRQVSGCIISLDKTDLQTADFWESVPLYQREQIEVLLGDIEKRKVWVYTRRQASGTPHAGDAIAGLDKATILQEIKGELS